MNRVHLRKAQSEALEHLYAQWKGSHLTRVTKVAYLNIYRPLDRKGWAKCTMCTHLPRHETPMWDVVITPHGRELAKEIMHERKRFGTSRGLRRELPI